MSRTLTLAGLLIDSWRDQPSQTALGELNLPASTIPISRFRGTSDDVPSTRRLTRLIELDAMKWEPR